MQFTFTKVSPRTVKKQRSFYKSRVRKMFVKWCAFKGYFDGVLTDKEIAEAKKGTLPKDLDVHHMVPLNASAQPFVNSFKNLTVLHKNTHKRINRQIFQPQLQDLEHASIGTHKVIDIPTFPTVDAKGIKEERKKVLTSLQKGCIISL